VFEFAEWLGASPLSIAVQSRTWLTPLLQSIHILMIGLVFGSILVTALRVLGRMRTDESIADVWQRFAPWFWPAIVVMAVTGIVLTIGEPVREVSATSFWLKMTLLAIGLISAAHFGRTLGAVAKGGSEQVSSGSRFMAVATVVLWLFIIFLGRAIAYDVEVWGSWHLG
jgi:putative copper export protein